MILYIFNYSLGFLKGKYPTESKNPQLLLAKVPAAAEGSKTIASSFFKREEQRHSTSNGGGRAHKAS